MFQIKITVIIGSIKYKLPERGKITLLLFCLFLVIFPIVDGYSQQITYGRPEKLNFMINSKSEETAPQLSQDGKILYFVRSLHSDNVGGEYAGSDIWFAEKDSSGEWGTPSNDIKQWNNKESNAVLGVNRNNNIIYLLNSYFGKAGIAFSKFMDEKWTAPEIIPIRNIEGDSYVGYHVNATYNVLLISMQTKKSFGLEDLYVSVKDSLEQWSAPINLGPTINTSGFEISPFLSEDGKKLYFSSDGHDGLGGADIYVSRRLYDSWTVWEKPINLGPTVNSAKFDSHYTTYGDTICYFASNRESSFSDIYQAKVITQNKNVLKDSVESIIKETQELLSNLKASTDIEKVNKEIIYFENSSTVISSFSKDFIESIPKKYNLSNLKTIEIMNFHSRDSDNEKEYDLELVRIQNLLNLLTMIGIEPSKIITKPTKPGVIKIKESTNRLELKLIFH